MQLVSNISAKSVTRTFVVTPARPKASLKPSKVKRGKKTTVTGSQFKPGEKVSIVVTRTSGGKGLKSKKIGTVKASSTGVVKKKFTVVEEVRQGQAPGDADGHPVRPRRDGEADRQEVAPSSTVGSLGVAPRRGGSPRA